MHERVSEEFLLARFALAVISQNCKPDEFSERAVMIPPEFVAPSKYPALDKLADVVDSVDEGT